MGCTRSYWASCPRLNTTSPQDCTGCVYYTDSFYNPPLSNVPTDQLLEELKRRMVR